MTPDEHRAIVIAYKQCFGTDAGTVVLADLSKFCLERRSTYVAGDPYQTAFNEGSRTVILQIRKRLEANLEERAPEKAISEEEK